MNSSKAIAGGLAGAVSVLLIWAGETFIPMDFPEAVEGAIAVIVGYAIVYFAPANTTS